MGVSEIGRKCLFTSRLRNTNKIQISILDNMAQFIHFGSQGHDIRDK